VKSCVECGDPLTGRQQKYCKKPICARRAYSKARIMDGRNKVYREGRGKAKRLEWQRANAAKYRGKYSVADECDGCGRPYVRDINSTKRRYCDEVCRSQYRLGYCRLPAEHPVRVIRREMFSRLSPLAAALEAQDSAEVVRLLLERTKDGPNGCALWTGKTSTGKTKYPKVTIRKKTLQAHRVMAAAVYGDLGPMAVHHKCAQSLCVKPDHLQPVTHRDNTAEMLHRQFYIRRIAELEAALREIDPTNDLLLSRPRLVA
jgi:hypothetical protein